MVVPISFSLAFLINFYLCSLDVTNLNFRVSVGFPTFQPGKTSSHIDLCKTLFVYFTVSWHLATWAQQLLIHIWTVDVVLLTWIKMCSWVQIKLKFVHKQLYKLEIVVDEFQSRKTYLRVQNTLRGISQCISKLKNKLKYSFKKDDYEPILKMSYTCKDLYIYFTINLL